MFSTSSQNQKAVLFCNGTDSTLPGLNAEITTIFAGQSSQSLSDSSFDLAIAKGVSVDQSLGIFFLVLSFVQTLN